MNNCAKPSICRQLPRSLELDWKLLHDVKGIPSSRKLHLILLKYSRFFRYLVSPGSGHQRTTSLLGERYAYGDAFGLASLQRVYCASHFLKEFVQPGAVILDVGANEGQFTHFSYNYLCAAKVVSIEPERRAYELLRRNSRTADLCLSCVVSDREGEVAFHVGQESSQLSTYIPDKDCSYSDSYSVPCRRLDDIAAERGIDHVGLLKVDTEGSEYDVLMSAEHLLPKVDFILIEMSILRRSSGGLFKTGRLLEKHGFRLVRFQCDGSSEPRDADALFQRT